MSCRCVIHFLWMNETVKFFFVIFGRQSSSIPNNICLKREGKWEYCSVLNACTKNSKSMAVFYGRLVVLLSKCRPTRETAQSFTVAVHFCEVYWCLFFRISPVIFKLEFDGKVFVTKVVYHLICVPSEVHTKWVLFCVIRFYYEIAVVWWF